ncbi:MAG: DUF177 domain-containing protein [Bacteroidales bacterium]|nr:DUF177 domain-containing protein [Bacteroidales bacterium]
MNRNEDTKVVLIGLKPGRYSYRFTLGDDFFAGYENEEIGGGKVEVEAEMEKNERVVLFRFRLEGEIETWCDRCLGEMKVKIEGEETLEVRFSDTEVSDEENVAILPEGASEVDLGRWLYEYVAVRLPLRHQHEEGECDPEMVKYLVSKDGEESEGQRAEREIDPRWEALKGLKQ